MADSYTKEIDFNILLNDSQQVFNVFFQRLAIIFKIFLALEYQSQRSVEVSTSSRTLITNRATLLIMNSRKITDCTTLSNGMLSTLEINMG